MFGRRYPQFHKLSFDELVPDALAHDLDCLEQPVSRRLFRVLGLGLLLASLIIFGRLVFLSVAQGSFYSARSFSNLSREIKTPAPRGLIVDRFGKPLVENIPTFSVILNVADFLRNSPEDQSRIIDSLSKILPLDSSEIKANLAALDLERNNELAIGRDIELDKAVAVKSLDLPGVFVVDDFRRHYLYPYSLSHLLGYTAEVNRADLIRDPLLDLGDTIGKTGLEAFYDDLLRGQKGQLVDFKDVRGDIIDQYRLSNPTAGSTLKLTIDSEFQEFFYQRLTAALNHLGRTAGVGLAMNPKTGEILAALSLPAFNNNSFVEDSLSSERLAWFSAPANPLFNRYVSGLYNPGSTIKPLVALAALAEGIVSPGDIFYSRGYIEIPNPYHPDEPSRFVDWKPHGWVNVRSALARSSNIYFYYVGGGFEKTVGLGINRLNDWWRRFRLDQPTGIDLPGEVGGFLPDPEEKTIRTGTPWRIGDTYNVSIGQGDLSITPLGLLNYISAISNGGYLYRPYLASDLLQPEVLADLSRFAPAIEEVKKGLVAAVTDPSGTANLLRRLPVSVAGKTGSAQVSGKTKTNAFFVGYAPANDPEISILILVEDAREGSLNTVPVAEEIFYWYYLNRLASS